MNETLMETIEIRQIPTGHQMGLALLTTLVGAGAAMLASKVAAKGYENLFLKDCPVKTFAHYTTV